MQIPDSISVDQVQLRGFSRSMAEIEWLLLILVLLYYVVPGTEIDNRFGLVISMVFFAVFVLAFRYAKFFTREKYGKLVIETLAMILFVSYAAYSAGGIHSPLLNLYLLVIIASALALGKLVTLLEFLLIACIYFYMGYTDFVSADFTVDDFSRMMILFAPYLLVGYVTTMLASDVYYGMDVLESMSQKDELTGLNNRRAFNTLLYRESRKASRYDRPYSVMMIDIDELKSVNDRLGHEAGDKLLVNVSGVIRDTLRESDVLARYGGDEFVVLLTETGIDRARDAAERIKTAIGNTVSSMDGNPVSSTVSIGIAACPDDSRDVNEILKFADKAMYQGKKDGKNTVTAYGDIA